MKQLATPESSSSAPTLPGSHTVTLAPSAAAATASGFAAAKGQLRRGAFDFSDLELDHSSVISGTGSGPQAPCGWRDMGPTTPKHWHRPGHTPIVGVNAFDERDSTRSDDPDDARRGGRASGASPGVSDEATIVITGTIEILRGFDNPDSATKNFHVIGKPRVQLEFFDSRKP